MAYILGRILAHIGGVIALFAVLVALGVLYGVGWGVLLAWQNVPWLVVALGATWLGYLLRHTFRTVASRRVPVEERTGGSSVGSQWLLSVLAVGLLAFGTWTAVGAQSSQRAGAEHRRERAEQKKELAERGYSDTGEDVTASECAAEGGTLEGDFCLTESEGLVEVGDCGESLGTQIEIHAPCRSSDYVVVLAPLVGADETARSVARRLCPPVTVEWTKGSLTPLQVVCWAER